MHWECLKMERRIRIPIEAFERSYQLGYRYFEVDVALTEDEKLVCCHGWSEKNCQVCGMEYQPEFDTDL